MKGNIRRAQDFDEKEKLKELKQSTNEIPKK